MKILLIKGKEYFPATECAKMLGHSNPERAIRTFCSGVTEIVTPSNKICAVIFVFSFFGADFSGIFAAILFFFIAIKTNQIGGGDVKIFAALSIVIGLINSLIMLFIANFSELIFAIFFKIIKREKLETLPMIPFLTLGYFVILIKEFLK